MVISILISYDVIKEKEGSGWDTEMLGTGLNNLLTCIEVRGCVGGCVCGWVGRWVGERVCGWVSEGALRCMRYVAAPTLLT